TWLPCRDAVMTHLARRAPTALPVIADLDAEHQPDSGSGPGLPEICRACHLAARPPSSAEPLRLERHLHFRPWEAIGPAWPHRGEPDQPLSGDPHFQRLVPREDEKTAAALRAHRTGPTRARWPRGRDDEEGTERPLVSVLFSPGV